MKFKLRIFRSCRSKHPSTLPSHPIPSFHRPFITTDDNNNNNQLQPHRSSFKSHVSSAFGCGSKSGDTFSDTDNYFQWQEDDNNWHVVAKIYDNAESPRRKIYNSSVSYVSSEDIVTDDDVFPVSLLPLPLPPLDKKKRRPSRKIKLHKLKNGNRNGDVLDDDDNNNTNSVSSENEQNVAVSEDETATLISFSRSFSSGSSSTDFNPHLETIREFAPNSFSKKWKKKRNVPLKRDIGGLGGVKWPEDGAPARLSVFKKMLPCEVGGKMRESFAMVKRSEDPYDDFKRSMVEMIMEKEMFEESDLEQLLQCYLSLNSRVHHGVIVEAFTEIWDAMFGD